MSAFILPPVLPGDTVASWSRRAVDAATRHTESGYVHAIGAEADVPTTEADRAYEWVRSVVTDACERIRYVDAWDGVPYVSADDPVCAEPYGDDDGDMPGWADLAGALSDTIADGDPFTDGWSEVADGAVSVYTHDRMTTYVDTLAYREDVTEYGTYTDPVDMAGVALYMQAERVARATAVEVAATLRSALPD